jgi:hypothetical protein
VRPSSEVGVFLFVSFLVSFANEISHGRYLGPAVACLAFALVVLAWRFVAAGAGPVAPAETRAKPTLWLVGCAAASMPVTALLDPKILAHPHTSLGVLRALEGASLLLLASYLPFLGARADSELVRRVRFAGFGAITLAAGAAIIHISPAPGIDVWDLQMQAAKALLRGENPYVGLTVPDTTPIHPYPTVPYVYAPGTLYAGVIGLWVGGDVRYAMLIALLVSGAALRMIARKRKPNAQPRPAIASLAEDAPALFVWLMPPLAFIIELAWTEPVQLMLICLAVGAAVSGRALLGAVLFGLALTTKQSMFWLIPLAGLALSYGAREWLAMLGTLVLGVAPFAIADFGALKHDTFDFLLALIPRSDALGLAVWYKSAFGRAFPTAASTVAAVCVVAATALYSRSLRMRAPGERDRVTEGAALFGRAAALTYFAFVFLAKQAFANYYFLVSGLTALAAATALRSSDERTYGDDPRRRDREGIVGFWDRSSGRARTRRGSSYSRTSGSR